MKAVHGVQGLELVGRDEELALIEAILDRAETGFSGLVLEGEPGIGKTTLWTAGIERARERGFRVLVARPAEAERALSFAALSDLLDGEHEEIANLPPAQRRPLAGALLLEEVKVEPRAIAIALVALLRAVAS